MIAQVPAEGILKSNDYGYSKFYTIPCACGDHEDDIKLEVEAEVTGVTVHHWVTVKTDSWSTPTKFRYINSLLHRIRLTYNLWFHGNIKYEAWTVMNKQQALNYSEVLKQAIEDVTKFRNK